MRILKKILLSVLVCTLGLFSVSCSKGSTSSTSKQADSSTIKENTSTIYDGIKLSDNVTKEMLNYDFWKYADWDKEIMSQQDVTDYNKEISTDMISKKVMYDLENADKNITGNEIKRIMDLYPLPSLKKFANGKPITNEYINSLKASTNTAAIKENVNFKYAICTERANVMSFPTDDFIASKSDDIFFNDIQEAELYINDPVVILHESLDGNWYFVLSNLYGGWIKKSQVALCSNKQEWTEWQACDDFLVVTADRCRLDVDPYQPAFSELELYMGMTLPLVKSTDAPNSIGKRAVYNNYIVRLPLRTKNGTLEKGYALVPYSDNVNVGYLKYTSEAVVKQAYKMLGNRYGWGGMFKSNDCSGYMAEVYKCFGIIIPRNSSQQADISGKSVSLTEKTSAEKTTLISQARPGCLLEFKGHIMMYLGTYNNEQYVISAVGYMVQQNDKNNISESVSTIVINTLNTRRSNGSTWTDNLEIIKYVEK